MRRPLNLFLLPGLVALVAGLSFSCTGPRYELKPQENAAVTPPGKEGATYNVPTPADPTGQVRVAVQDVVDIKPDEQSEVRVRALKVTMGLNNNSDSEQWRLNVKNLQATVGTEAPRGPMMIQSERVEFLPYVIVDAGSDRTLDLYYPLPAGYKEVESIPRVELEWQVQAGDEIVQRTTPFERVQVRPDPTYVDPWGPALPGRAGTPPASYWWFDPAYPGI